RDSLPQHWYTDWEDILMDSFYNKGTPFNQIMWDANGKQCYNKVLTATPFDFNEYREYFYLNNATCFNAKLNLRDTAHPLKCENETSTQITLLGASAKKLTVSGVYCLGGLQQEYGVNFHLDDTKPGCTSNYAYLNKDVNF